MKKAQSVHSGPQDRRRRPTHFQYGERQAHLGYGLPLVRGRRRQERRVIRVWATVGEPLCVVVIPSQRVEVLAPSTEIDAVDVHQVADRIELLLLRELQGLRWRDLRDMERAKRMEHLMHW